MNDKELIDILFARIEGWIVNAYFEDEPEKLIDAVYHIEALVAELKTVLDAKIEALTAEIEKLRKALEFYAEAKNWAYVKSAGCNCIDADGGDTARAALGEQP
jgi:hypothetical protein